MCVCATVVCCLWYSRRSCITESSAKLTLQEASPLYALTLTGSNSRGYCSEHETLHDSLKPKVKSFCVLKVFPGFWPLNGSWKLHNWVTGAIFRQHYLEVTLKPDLTVLCALLNFIWQSSFGFRANRSFGGLYKQFAIMLFRVSKSLAFLFWLGSYVRVHRPGDNWILLKSKMISDGWKTLLGRKLFFSSCHFSSICLSLSWSCDLFACRGAKVSCVSRSRVTCSTQWFLLRIASSKITFLDTG